MVEGFKLKVTSAELKEHCEHRAMYHSERADEKRNKTLPQLREALESVKSTSPSSSISHMNKGTYHMDPDDPVKDLERDIRNHENKALVFQFFATHLIDDDYTLQEADLVKLEILKQQL